MTNDVFIRGAQAVTIDRQTVQPDNPVNDPVQRIVITVKDAMNLTTTYITIEQDAGLVDFPVEVQDHRLHNMLAS